MCPPPQRPGAHGVCGPRPRGGRAAVVVDRRDRRVAGGVAPCACGPGHGRERSGNGARPARPAGDPDAAAVAGCLRRRRARALGGDDAGHVPQPARGSGPDRSLVRRRACGRRHHRRQQRVGAADGAGARALPAAARGVRRRHPCHRGADGGGGAAWGAGHRHAAARRHRAGGAGVGAYRPHRLLQRRSRAARSDPVDAGQPLGRQLAQGAGRGAVRAGAGGGGAAAGARP